jgi:hypothetical protein
MKIRSDGPIVKINFVVVLVKVAYREHPPLPPRKLFVSPAQEILSS